MSIGQIPMLISVYGMKAITQASLFCSQEEGFCPRVQAVRRLLQVLQRPLHELERVAVNAGPAFCGDGSAGVLGSPHEPGAEQAERRQQQESQPRLAPHGRHRSQQ